MSLGKAALAAHWQYYSDRSHAAHFGRSDKYGHGREEQLWEILRAISDGRKFTHALMAELDRLPHNRSKKHLRLLQTMALVANQAGPDGGSAVDDADEIEFVTLLLSPIEISIERHLARGDSYELVAADLGISVGALKMRVNRSRQRVRMRCIAA